MASLEDTNVFICTSPIKMYKYCPYEKYAWVEKHLGPGFLDHVVLTRDKTVISADLLIDDRPDITGKGRAQPQLGARALHRLPQPARPAAAPPPQAARLDRPLEGPSGQQAAPLSGLPRGSLSGPRPTARPSSQSCQALH
uniref:5',3'-nucleotidase, mitochondrial n=1 Tax=Molossus molossus TaxID=27622 RepID=A0A7J8BIL3_MOLMO|nr:5',3'-nucleotidase, mitochondrial [Molossus molossus]